jgi:hypothetical protein
LNYLKRLIATEKSRPLHVIFHRLCVDDGFKTAVAFPTAPKMTILMLTPILGPFGGDQLIVALNAGHPEGGTKIGFYHRRNLNVFDFARIRKEVTDLWQHITQGLNDLNVGRDDERASFLKVRFLNCVMVITASRA